MTELLAFDLSEIVRVASRDIMSRQPRSTVLTALLCVVLLCGFLLNVSLSQERLLFSFAESSGQLPTIRTVSWLQPPADGPDEPGADVNKSTQDGTGPSVPQADITMEEYFDQQISSQLGEGWRFSANYTGAQAGQPIGYTSLNVLGLGAAGMVLDSRLHITDFGNVGGSVGLGRRSITDNQLMGLHVSLDASETQAGSRFVTASVSGEWVNETWDVRGNGYWPVSNQVGSASFSSISNTAFVGNSLVGNVAILQEVSLGGFDLDASRRVGGSDLWGYGGVYNFQIPGDQTWGARYGVRGFLANRVFADLHVSNDSMFGSQVGFGLSWLFGGPAVESSSVAERMASIPVRRQGLVATQFNTVSLPGETLTNPNGTPLVVQHVDSTVAPGGDGSVATPYDTLAAVEAAAQPDDIIHLKRDSVFVGESITLQNGQQLLGESDLPDGNFLDTQFGTAALPSGLGGTNPAQISTAPGLAAITLAGDTTVINTVILAPVNNGILGNGFAGDVTLENLTILGAGDNGIDLASISGNINISNSQIINSNASGIQAVDVESLAIEGVLVETVDLGGGGGWGLSVTTTGFNFSELTASANIFNAIMSSNSFQAQALGNSGIRLFMSDNDVDGNYDLFAAPGSFMEIAGNLGVGNFFINDDNGNLADNGNTTLFGPPNVNPIGEFLIIPW